MASPVGRLQLEVGEVDLDRRVLATADGPVRLTTREVALLAYLAAHADRPVDRDELSREVWEHSAQVISRAIDSTMSRLRAKVERDPAAPRHLVTVHGLGYRFVPLQRPEGEALGIPTAAADERVSWGAVTVDLAAATVSHGDEPIGLTGTEIELIRLLLARPGQVVDRGALQRRVWGGGGSERALHNALHRLRAKLGEHVLQTVRGQGVRLRPPTADVAGLPPRRGPLIGRDDLLDAIVDAFGAGRLVSLLGPGGVGKTRLAVEYGSLGGWVGGAAWIDASVASDADGLCRQVADALDVSLQQAHLDRAIGHALAARGEFLLILDNLEQVGGPAASLVEAWLRRAPHLGVLATSREPLRVSGERRVLVTPLREDDGIALFDARVAELASAADDRDAVRALARGLDGLPLAIELAAARAPALGVAPLLDRLDQRFEILGDPLEATVAWSWELLDPVEQRAWARLCVFRAPFDLATAERMVERVLAERSEAVEASRDHADVAGVVSPLDLVQSLVEKSLLSVVPGQAGPRYAVLASLAAFGRARLDGEELEATRRRYVAALAELGSDACLELAPEVAGAAWGEVAHDAYPDLLHAVALGRRIGMPEEAARCAIAAMYARRSTGPHGELAALGVRASSDALSDGTRSMLLSMRARSEHASGRSDEARALAERALAISETPFQQMEAYRALGEALINTASSEALAVRRRLVELAREHGSPAAMLLALEGLGIAELYSGATDDADAHWAEALRLARREGLDGLAVSVQGNRAVLLHSLGAHDAAKAAYEEVIAEMVQRGNPAHGAHLANLANLLAGRGHYDEAEVLYQRAIALQRRIGDLHHTGFVYANLGYALTRKGDRTAARRAVERALEHLDPANRMGRGFALATLGELERLAGSWVRARRCLDEAEACLGDGAYPFPRILALCARSRLASDEGDRPTATSCLAEAESLAARCGLEADAEARIQIDAARAALRPE